MEREEKVPPPRQKEGDEEHRARALDILQQLADLAAAIRADERAGRLAADDARDLLTGIRSIRRDLRSPLALQVADLYKELGRYLSVGTWLSLLQSQALIAFAEPGDAMSTVIGNVWRMLMERDMAGPYADTHTSIASQNFASLVDGREVVGTRDYWETAYFLHSFASRVGAAIVEASHARDDGILRPLEYRFEHESAGERMVRETGEGTIAYTSAEYTGAAQQGHSITRRPSAAGRFLEQMNIANTSAVAQRVTPFSVPPNLYAWAHLNGVVAFRGVTPRPSGNMRVSDTAVGRIFMPHQQGDAAARAGIRITTSPDFSALVLHVGGRALAIPADTSTPPAATVLRAMSSYPGTPAPPDWLDDSHLGGLHASLCEQLGVNPSHFQSYGPLVFVGERQRPIFTAFIVRAVDVKVARQRPMVGGVPQFDVVCAYEQHLLLQCVDTDAFFEHWADVLRACKTGTHGVDAWTALVLQLKATDWSTRVIRAPAGGTLVRTYRLLAHLRERYVSLQNAATADGFRDKAHPLPVLHAPENALSASIPDMLLVLRFCFTPLHTLNTADRGRMVALMRDAPRCRALLLEIAQVFHNTPPGAAPRPRTLFKQTAPSQ